MIANIIAAIFLIAGLVVCLTSIIGIYRLPDFYSRCHTSGNSETIGLLLVCIGFGIYSGLNMILIKLLILFVFVCICNPIGSHVLAKAAYQGGFPMTVTKKKSEEGEE